MRYSTGYGVYHDTISVYCSLGPEFFEFVKQVSLHCLDYK